MQPHANVPNFFVHLRAHSEYSIRDGLLRIKPWVAAVKAQQMSAVALTDFVNLFGLVKFYKAALAAGVKPIIGADLVLDDQGETSTFTALCQNQQGYHELTQLISTAYLNGQHDGMPTVQWADVVAHQEGLIILSGGCHGDVGQALLKDHRDKAETLCQRWSATFPNRFYLALTRTGRPQEEDYLHLAVDCAEKYQIPVVATNDVRFLSAEDFEAHEARVCIYESSKLSDDDRVRTYSDQQYLRSSEEMVALFDDIPEAIANTVEIAKRCNVTLTLGQPCLPNFPIPEGDTVEVYLEKKSREGLDAIFSAMQIPEAQRPAYHERLQIELDVINRMGFPGYFLIVADFIAWAKSQHIPVGPGRGSGAGSLVAYALGITALDPIEHELLFERFLNPERISMPDFDIDFCMEKRDAVIEYVAQRYGREAVSQIITFGTMAAKAVVRDVGRVLGLSYGYVDKIAKLIPFELGMTLEKALAQEPQLQELYEAEEDVATLIDLAKKLEGVVRNAGKHAGGVVIARSKLTDFAPLYCEPGGANLVTQFDKDDAEEVGLVKFDFLGLRTLTIIDWALQAVNEKRQKNGEPPIDILKIPLDDAKTFELLHHCATTAVFQLESRGMKDLIRRLKPDSFEDVTALVALFRPGPLQSGMVDDFIDRKHGRAQVEYPHPDLKAILQPTYGVILYQEQVMQIAQVLAGYTLGGADILRRAMGKKKPEEMAKQRLVFTEGAVKRGIDQAIAEHIFDLMEKFAGYGFNKSHSAAYALIAYQTAWLKAHYPAEFMAAVLSSDMDNTDKVVGFLEECRRMKLDVLPPNINAADYPFRVNAKGDIEYGLGAIKGAGQAACEHIVQERLDHGKYSDLFNFCQRLDTHKVNRRVLEPLITSGAMDDFGVHRASLLASIPKALRSAEQALQNESAGQHDLFGEVASQITTTDYVDVKPLDNLSQLKAEKAVLGHYVSGHPLQTVADELKHMASTQLAALIKKRGETATVAGMLISIRKLVTRTQRRMAVLVLEDLTGRTEVTVFSKLYEQIAQELIIDQVYIISGNVEDDDFTGGVRLVAESIETLERNRRVMVNRFLLRAHRKADVDALLEHLPDVIKNNPGGCPIIIDYQTPQASAQLALGKSWRLMPSGEAIAALQELCGPENVTIQY